MKKLYLGFVRDHSGSMSGVASTAKDDFNALIADYKLNSEANMFFTQVSVVQCGVKLVPNARYDHEYGNKFAEILTPIGMVPHLTAYESTGNTPLYDAVDMLIDQFSALPDAKSDNVQFMIMVLTDGAENASKKASAYSLSQKIKAMQATDSWTFTFRVPKGYGSILSRDLGIPIGNTHEWDGRTKESYVESTNITKSATTAYFTASSLGAKSTDKFYTDLSNVSVAQVASKMTDVSRQVKVFTTTGTEIIKPFIERMTGQFLKGTAYYQLTKTEDVVQDYKIILIVDKKTGATYAGRDARELLGLPTSGNCRLAPGNHGNYEVYIQSTSLNRKLPGGTKLIVWDQMASVGVTPITVVKPQKSPPHVLSNTTSGIHPQWPSNATPVTPTSVGANHDYVVGYKDGKSHKRMSRSSMDYVQGYRDGRGKKSPLVVA